jgi:hypothetical protein
MNWTNASLEVTWTSYDNRPPVRYGPLEWASHNPPDPHKSLVVATEPTERQAIATCCIRGLFEVVKKVTLLTSRAVLTIFIAQNTIFSALLTVPPLVAPLLSLGLKVDKVVRALSCAILDRRTGVVIDLAIISP